MKVKSNIRAGLALDPDVIIASRCSGVVGVRKFIP